jgi:hypothetical protein
MRAGVAINAENLFHGVNSWLGRIDLVCMSVR